MDFTQPFDLGVHILTHKVKWISQHIMTFICSTIWSNNEMSVGVLLSVQCYNWLNGVVICENCVNWKFLNSKVLIYLTCPNRAVIKG